MPVAVIVESGAGDALANAFQSVADVTARLASYLFGAAWAAAPVNADRQALCVIEATAQLSRIDWQGERVVATQGTAWPRRNVVERDGYALPSNALPTWLLDAHARQSLYLYTLTETPYADVGLEPRTALTIGPIQLTPQSPTGTLSPDVRAIIAPYMRSGAGVRTVVRC